MGFYGDVLNTGDSPFVFDKIYSSRYHMEQSMNEDEVFAGRYVLVSYDSNYTQNDFTKAYRKTGDNVKTSTVPIHLYKDVDCTTTVKFRNSNLANEEESPIGAIYYVDEGSSYTYYKCSNYDESTGEAWFVYLDSLNGQWREAFKPSADYSASSSNYITLYSKSTCANDEVITNTMTDDVFKDIVVGDVVYVRDYANEQSNSETSKGIYYFYELIQWVDNEARFKYLETVIGHHQDGSLENYKFNQKLDWTIYGQSELQSYDKTVWQKVYVGNIEKYIKVAELNSENPDILLSVNPPTQQPIAPYFDADIEGNDKDLHIQSPWGFRVRAANHALSSVGMLTNPATGNRVSFNEFIDLTFNNYLQSVFNAEQEYQQNYNLARQGFDSSNTSYITANGILDEIISLIYNSEKIKTEDDELETLVNITTTIQANFKTMVQEYLYDDSFMTTSYEYNSEFTMQRYRNNYTVSNDETDITSTLNYSLLVKEYTRTLLGDYYSALELDDSSEDQPKLITGLQALINKIIIDSSNVNATGMFKTSQLINLYVKTYNQAVAVSAITAYNQILNAIRTNYTTLILHDYTISTDEDSDETIESNTLIDELLNDIELSVYNTTALANNYYLLTGDFEDLSSDELEVEKNEQIDSFITTMGNKVRSLLSNLLILSDEDTVWNYVGDNGETFYYNDTTDIWDSDTASTLAGDIYYNKAGFDKDIHHRVDENLMTDCISVQPSGFTQDYSDDGWINRQYNAIGADYTNETVEQPDTQELSIHLPSVGNTISDVWDVVYGSGIEDDEGNLVRQTKVDWDTTGEADTERIRMIYHTEDGSGYTYDTNAVSTVAGAINSVQDLMGRIIEEDYIGSDNTYYINASTVPSAEIKDYVDQDKIYYFSGSEKYYRRNEKYDLDETCYSIDEFTTLVEAEQLYTRVLNTTTNQYDYSLVPSGSTWSTTTQYYRKKVAVVIEDDEEVNKEIYYEVLIYDYVTTKDEYENQVQGYTKVDAIEDPNNLGTDYFYYDTDTQTYVYNKYYDKTKTYLTIELESHSFAPGTNEYRYDENTNLIKDTVYAWNGDNYFDLSSFFTSDKKSFIFVPNQYYVQLSDHDYDLAETFDEDQIYYSITINTTDGISIEDPTNENNTIYIPETDTVIYTKVYEPNGTNNFINFDTDENYYYVFKSDILKNNELIIPSAWLHGDINAVSDGSLLRVDIDITSETFDFDDPDHQIFYSVPKSALDEGIISEYYVSKYEPSTFYYKVGNNYQKDISDTGSASRLPYYTITYKNAEFTVYQPGTEFYYKTTSAVSNKDLYVLSSAEFDSTLDYYTHNTYYVTNSYDNYEVGQIWDYTLPWTDYVLDSNDYRDTTNYLQQILNLNYRDGRLYFTIKDESEFNSLITENKVYEYKKVVDEDGDAVLNAKGQEVFEYSLTTDTSYQTGKVYYKYCDGVIYRDYYYDSEGSELVEWAEDFIVDEADKYYYATEYAQCSADETYNPELTYYQIIDTEKELTLDNLKKAYIYEPGKYFYQSPQDYYTLANTYDEIKEYFYDSTGQNKVLLRSRFNDIITSEDIYYYNTNDSYTEVSTEEFDENQFTNYFMDNQGEVPVYFTEKWNYYKDNRDNVRYYNFYLPNFDKVIDTDNLDANLNYYQNDLTRTKIHLKDTDWLTAHINDYKAGYYPIVEETADAPLLSRTYYTDENATNEVQYMSEQFDNYKTNLKVQKTYKVPKFELDSEEITLNREYFKTSDGSQKAFLIQQYANIKATGKLFVKHEHEVLEYSPYTPTSIVEATTEYYRDSQGTTPIYFASQFNNWNTLFDNNNATVYEYNTQAYLDAGEYDATIAYYDKTTHDEVYLIERFDSYVASGLESNTGEENAEWLTVNTGDVYNSALQYRFADTSTIITFINYDANNLVYIGEAWGDAGSTYEADTRYKINDIELFIVNDTIEGWNDAEPQQVYYIKVSDETITEYTYDEPGDTYLSTEDYYYAGESITFENYAVNTFYYLNINNEETKYVYVQANESKVDGQTYYLDDGITPVTFVKFSEGTYYYISETMSFKTVSSVSDFDFNNKIYKYNDSIILQSTDWHFFEDVRNYCWYYHDETDDAPDYILQDTYDSNIEYYYIYTYTGIEAIKFISIDTTITSDDIYYLLNDTAVERTRFIKCTNSDSFSLGKKYFKPSSNENDDPPYTPVLFESWIVNRYYVEDNDNKPLTLAMEDEMQHVVGSETEFMPYYLDSTGQYEADPIQDGVVGLYCIHDATNFTKASVNQTIEDHENYYIKITSSTTTSDYIICLGSDGLTYHIKQINGIYYDITNQEYNVLNNESFNISSLPKVYSYSNGSGYIRKKLATWKANTYYYANDYSEAVTSCQLVSKELLEKYKKYYFSELTGFGRNYNSIHGLILQFNKLLGDSYSSDRNLNTLYGSLKLLNDEIRRLQIYDFSTVNNIVSSIEYSFKTVKQIHDSLKSLQGQSGALESSLLYEWEAAENYLSIQDFASLVGVDTWTNTATKWNNDRDERESVSAFTRPATHIRVYALDEIKNLEGYIVQPDDNLGTWTSNELWFNPITVTVDNNIWIVGPGEWDPDADEQTYVSKTGQYGKIIGVDSGVTTYEQTHLVTSAETSGSVSILDPIDIGESYNNEQSNLQLPNCTPGNTILDEIGDLKVTDAKNLSDIKENYLEDDTFQKFIGIDPDDDTAKFYGDYTSAKDAFSNLASTVSDQGTAITTLQDTASTTTTNLESAIADISVIKSFLDGYLTTAEDGTLSGDKLSTVLGNLSITPSGGDSSSDDDDDSGSSGDTVIGDIGFTSLLDSSYKATFKIQLICNETTKSKTYTLSGSITFKPSTSKTLASGISIGMFNTTFNDERSFTAVSTNNNSLGLKLVENTLQTTNAISLTENVTTTFTFSYSFTEAIEEEETDAVTRKIQFYKYHESFFGTNTATMLKLFQKIYSSSAKYTKLSETKTFSLTNKNISATLPSFTPPTALSTAGLTFMGWVPVNSSYKPVTFVNSSSTNLPYCLNTVGGKIVNTNNNNTALTLNDWDTIFNGISSDTTTTCSFVASYATNGTATMIIFKQDGSVRHLSNCTSSSDTATGYWSDWAGHSTYQISRLSINGNVRYALTLRKAQNVSIGYYWGTLGANGKGVGTIRSLADNNGLNSAGVITNCTQQGSNTIKFLKFSCHTSSAKVKAYRRGSTTKGSNI